jgi:multisubunit Na+/H+ antiporter MnhB subunit
VFQQLPLLLFVGTVGALLYFRFRKNPVTSVGQMSGINQLMPVIVSLIVILASLYVILSQQFPDDDKKWAYTSVGTILGYWLRPAAQA